MTEATPTSNAIPEAPIPTSVLETSPMAMHSPAELAELGRQVAGELRGSEHGLSAEDLDMIGEALLDTATDPDSRIAATRKAVLGGELVKDITGVLSKLPATLVKLRDDHARERVRVKSDSDLSSAGKQRRKQELTEKYQKAVRQAINEAFRKPLDLVSVAIGAEKASVRTADEKSVKLDRATARGLAADRLQLVLAIHGPEGIPPYLERVGRSADPILSDVVELASEIGVPPPLAFPLGMALRSIEQARSERVTDAVRMGTQERLEAVVRRAVLRQVREQMEAAKSLIEATPLDPGMPTMALKKLAERLA